ncbi:hypothetical protein ACQP2U_23755 [Nocardia sp. CA-084685]|uniref:hypothetical protein n=1 Tax=Nocardia sp. CA-084685 TaxID=3239970 RepID=UPI003D971AB2
MAGELPDRASLSTIFDHLDYQLACQAYLWSLPLVSYAQWQSSIEMSSGPVISTSCTM